MGTIFNDDFRDFIQALNNHNKTDFYFPILSGAQMGLKAFEEWIEKSEEAPAESLTEAKSKWAEKRKRLSKLTQ